MSILLDYENIFGLYPRINRLSSGWGLCVHVLIPLQGGYNYQYWTDHLPVLNQLLLFSQVKSSLQGVFLCVLPVS